MAKLTLNVDAGIVTRAKRYAARRGTSVSRLVERFLALLSGAAGSKDGADEAISPVLARLREDLEGTSGDRADYEIYLERKYR